MFLLLQMLTAIQLYHQFLAWGTEVHDVIANGVLIAKMYIAHSMST